MNVPEETKHWRWSALLWPEHTNWYDQIEKGRLLIVLVSDLKANCHSTAFLQAFDAVPDLEILDARTRANPYERIGSAFFMNRAAMTIANLDRVFSFMLSGETDDDKILVTTVNISFFFNVTCFLSVVLRERLLWIALWTCIGVSEVLILSF